MSDNEEYEEEVEAEEAPKSKSSKPSSRRHSIEGGKEKTEAELAMLAQKRKQEEDEKAKLAQYEEERRMQREKEEEELRLLKEKQERRKAEREEEERVMAERRREEEERRSQEEEERRQKLEEIKRRKDDEKKKRQELLMAGFQMGGIDVQKSDKTTQDKFDKFGNIVKAKAEMGLTKEQHQEQKRRHLAEITKSIDFSKMDMPTLKSKLKELHSRLSRLEGDRYDLEIRRTRQDYDLKELNERQRQISRGKALKKGMNPDQVEAGPHPPKIAVINKYDRQIDRRSFTERRSIYDKPKAFPHFPNVPPMVQDLVKEIKHDEKKADDEEAVEEEEE